MSFKLVILCALLSCVVCDVCVTPVHYAQLGCTPVENPDGCPKSFDCSHLKTRSDEVCYLGGHSTAAGETFPYPVNMTSQFAFSSPICYDTCTCVAKKGDEAATLECKDCAVKPSGDPVLEADSVCTQEGAFYKEGDQVIVKDNTACKKTFCRTTGLESVDLDCGLELFSQHLLDLHCAPSYGYKKCCPSRWRCPVEGEEVVPAATPVESDLECTFGALKLKLQETLPFDNDTCSNCKCDLPPMVTCIIDESCTPSLFT